MADALLGIVIGNLQTFVQNELATFWGVASEIKKLSSNLTAIHAVLQDAEEKQITSHAVKDWLQKLSDAAYVLDDILDACSIESDRLQGDQENYGSAGKVSAACLTPFHPSTILFRREIGYRMKAIVERFHIIDEERKRFELRASVIERQQEDDDWRLTCSVITEPHIYGRDQDKEKIVEFLSRHAVNSDNLSVYPVVGMGGLGKTTLARWVFNDNRVIKHFDLRIWVCVSNDFNIMRILQSILETTKGHNPNLSTFESMQKKVQEVLQGKRYFLVLDDVWNEEQDKWEKLKSVWQFGSGTKGASVLVTTRLDNVASIMGTCQTHHLSSLSEDDSWSLFKQHAFGPNREERAELVAIGKEIVRKCAGSPLASKALGSLLRNKNDKKQWLSVKESKFWDISQGDVIMRALRISYFNLNMSLRRCFSFCAIYPEDFEISKEQLIHLWMANGLIKSRENLEVEDVGNEAWEELLQRSFFQEVKTDLFGNTTFKIHDLFLELAQSIMGEECKASESEDLNNLSSRVHHISCLDIYKRLNLDMDCLKRCESLRTFIQLYRSSNIDGLEGFNSLRALRTNSFQLSALKSLIHLRYLSLYESHITTLPECVSGLRKLQILKLEDCRYLSCLPKHLAQLKDLRHILIEGCSSLVAMSPNIGELKCLKTLNIFIVDSKPGFGVGELRDLQLGGKLHIKGLENVLNECDARSANLISKNELNRLFLSWGDCNSYSVCTKSERILEALEPPSSLKSFGMKGYRGRQFPSWMFNTPIISGLSHIILSDCKNCEQLPPLGKLPHLAYLNVSGMSNLKFIDADSYDGVEGKAFMSLKELRLSGLPSLERILRDQSVAMLPLLSKLRVSCVPRLKLPLLPAIEHLHIEGLKSSSGSDGMASFPVAILQNLPHVKTLSIQQFPTLKTLPSELGSFSSLQRMEIGFCDELMSSSEIVFQSLSSLRSLRIFWCKKLESLFEGVGQLTFLETLEIVGCQKLVTLPNNINHLSALRHVRISCTSTLPEGLQCIPFLQSLRIAQVDADSLPEWLGDMTSLQKIQIYDCSELRSLPSSFQHLTNLSELSIDSCPELRSLPSGFEHLTNLHELCIEDCPKLEKQCKRGTGEDWQNIALIPKIQITSQRKLTLFEKIQFKWMQRKIERGQRPPNCEFDRIVDVL